MLRWRRSTNASTGSVSHSVRVILDEKLRLAPCVHRLFGLNLSVFVHFESIVDLFGVLRSLE
jgi:hypothetical protein